MAHSTVNGWTLNDTHARPRSSGTMIALALVFHGMAAWLVLSGTGMKIVNEAIHRPPVVFIPPPDPEPPRPRPSEPTQRNPSRQPVPATPPLVPAPEDAPVTSQDAPVLASQPATSSDPPSQPGANNGPHSSSGPRGFGSITNRSECSAAFTQSFPRDARRAGQQGAVTLQVRVSATGVVEAAEVISAQPRRVFDRAALGVMLSGACRFESDAAGYTAVLQIDYRLSGDSPD